MSRIIIRIVTLPNRKTPPSSWKGGRPIARSTRLPASVGDWAKLDASCLDFPRRGVVRYSSRGNPYLGWVPCGMPRIGDAFLECAFYLYPSREAAEKGTDAGGTGFVVGVESVRRPGRWFLYAVSNRHVVWDGGSCVIRLNRRDGGAEAFETEPTEWTPHPAGDDLVAIPLGVGIQPYKLRFIPERQLITKQSLAELDLGVGDEIFMVGRFIRHDGKETNMPSARFGNVSIMLANIWQPGRQFNQESFAVEMRSMSGYSGSPVFVYRTELFLTENFDRAFPGVGSVYLLGVEWGYIVEELHVREKYLRSQLAAAGTAHERLVSFVQANTGMNGVVPAWKISELLHTRTFEDLNARADEEALSRAAEQRGGIELAAAPPTI